MDHAGTKVPFLYPHTKLNDVNFPSSSLLCLHQSEVDVTFTATSSTENVLGSGGFVDVRIPAGSTSIVTHMVIELTIRAGSTGIVVMPVPIVWVFDRIELLGESGATLISRHEPQQLISPLRHLSEAQLQLLQRPLNFWSGRVATEYGTHGAYPQAQFMSMTPNQEKTFYVPITDCALTTNKIFCGGLRSDLYVRCWFRGPSAFLLDGAGTMPSLKTLNVILTQDALSPRERQQMMYRYQSESLDFRFQRPSFQSMRATLGPSQRYQWQLSAVMGLVTELIITVVPDNNPAGLRNGFAQISSYEILDGSGASVLGGSAIKEDFATLVKAARKTQSRALFACKYGEADNVIVVEFGDSKANQDSGIVSGYLPMDGSYQLAISTPPGFQAADYEVRVEYLSCARLNISKGQLTVHPS
jgi:hypothetical protein